jgi:hypothetical protein
MKTWLKVWAAAGSLLLPTQFAGAITAGAVDFHEGATGLTWNYHTAAQAKKWAISEARKAGGTNIQIVFTSRAIGFAGLGFGRSASGRGLIAYGSGFHSRSSLASGLLRKLRAMGAHHGIYTLIGRNTHN